MAKINIPPETLPKEAFRTLPAKEKEEYVRNLLKKILELNPEGIIISQIKEATGLTYSTMWHHLEVLHCVAEGRKISKGNIDVYYPMGKVSHLNDYDKGGVKYILDKVENNEGVFICIYEERQKGLGNYTVCKGIAIPVELIDNLINDIGKIK